MPARVTDTSRPKVCKSAYSLASTLRFTRSISIASTGRAAPSPARPSGVRTRASPKCKASAVRATASKGTHSTAKRAPGKVLAKAPWNSVRLTGNSTGISGRQRISRPSLRVRVRSPR
jgi:hypothetical protein